MDKDWERCVLSEIWLLCLVWGDEVVAILVSMGSSMVELLSLALVVGTAVVITVLAVGTVVMVVVLAAVLPVIKGGMTVLASGLLKASNPLKVPCGKSLLPGIPPIPCLGEGVNPGNSFPST